MCCRGGVNVMNKTLEILNEVNRWTITVETLHSCSIQPEETLHSCSIQPEDVCKGG